MSPERSLLGLLLLVALVVGSNLIMYGIARNLSRGDGRWLQALTKNLYKPPDHRDDAMDELRRRVKGLPGDDQNG